MIEFLTAPTPNGWKVAIMLEECGLPYRIHPVDIGRGEQYSPDFLAISPNNRIPAIIDHDPGDGAPPLPLFESGAILLYLAEKSDRLLPRDTAGRFAVIQWLMWQMAGLGPMLGQHGHFHLYAREKIPYAIDRYRNEALRLYRVLDRRLNETDAFVGGSDYSIADIACFPWVMTHKAQGFSLDAFSAVKRWFACIRNRDAVQRGIAAGKDQFAQRNAAMDDAMREKFFGLGKAG